MADSPKPPRRGPVLVEYGPAETVLANPKHPYTRALLSATPEIDAQARRERIRLAGDLPSPANPPAGCHFHPRCPHAMAQCQIDYPGERRFGKRHAARCFLY